MQHIRENRVIISQSVSLVTKFLQGSKMQTHGVNRLVGDKNIDIDTFGWKW